MVKQKMNIEKIISCQVCSRKLLFRKRRKDRPRGYMERYHIKGLIVCQACKMCFKRNGSFIRNSRKKYSSEELKARQKRKHYNKQLLAMEKEKMLKRMSPEDLLNHMKQFNED